MARCVQGTGGGAFNVDDPFGGEVVPPALDLSELAQATTWWVQWAPVTGKLPAVRGLVPPSSWQSGTCRHRPHRPLEGLTRTEPADPIPAALPRTILLSQGGPGV